MKNCMDSIIIQKISEKVKLLPNNMAEQVLSYIEMLLSKNNNDWFENLSDLQKKSIEKGLEDIKYGRINSHDSVMEEMANYINSKKS